MIAELWGRQPNFRILETRESGSKKGLELISDTLPRGSKPLLYWHERWQNAGPILQQSAGQFVGGITRCLPEGIGESLLVRQFEHAHLLTRVGELSLREVHRLRSR